jgi:thiol-disulfide isomerase/thioredoxin
MTVKRTISLLTIVFSVSGICLSQGPDNSLRLNQLKQQNFVATYIKDHPFPPRFNSVNELDEYFQKLTNSWTNHTNSDSLPKLSLSPYVYIWTLYKFGGTDAARWQQQWLFTRYMVPAYLNNFKRFITTQQNENAFALRISDMSYICDSYALSSSLPLDRWVSLTESIKLMPSLLDTYINQWSASDTLIPRELKRIKRIINEFLPLLEIKNALYHSQRDTALNLLANALNQEYEASYLLLLANELWRSYLDANLPQNAENVLDQLARSLTVVELPDDSLRTWYHEADPQTGDIRYQRVAKSTRPPILISSNEHVQLTGVYTDLNTGLQINLDTLRRKPILLDFWATWCGPCIADIPSLNKLVADYGNEFVLVSVCGDSLTHTADKTTARKFVKDHGITYIALWDEPGRSLTDRFGVEALGWPMKFFMDKSLNLFVHPRERSRHYVKLEEVRAFLTMRP